MTNQFRFGSFLLAATSAVVMGCATPTPCPECPEVPTFSGLCFQYTAVELVGRGYLFNSITETWSGPHAVGLSFTEEETLQACQLGIDILVDSKIIGPMP